MSDQVEFDKSKMRKSALGNNRSNWQMFAIITKTDAYILDIREHPSKAGYTAFSLLQIVDDNNWLDKAGLGTVPVDDIAEFPENPTDEEIYELYKSHCNVFLKINDKICGNRGKVGG